MKAILAGRAASPLQKTGLKTIVAAVLLAAAPAMASEASVTGRAASQDRVLLAQAAKAPAAPGAATPSAATPSAAVLQAELDALIKAARAEGDFTFYIALVDSVAKRVGDAFTAKYGVKYSFVRLSTGPLAQRYFAEAESGNIAADMVIFAGPHTAFTVDGVKKGWVEPLSAANLPAVRSGAVPARFNKGETVIVQVAPWQIGYNTQKVKAAEAPRSLDDVLNPKWKGQLQVSDPRVGTTIAEFWAMVLDVKGEGFFTQLRAQNPRLYPGGAQSIQALGAGEGSIMVPVLVPQLLGPKDKGAPLEIAKLEQTTGIEASVILTARNKAKRPNAARLFANYLISPEGNKVLNSDTGAATIYDTGGLPSQYQPPSPTGAARADFFAKLLGFN
jgi:iron(III) transport system substrate-binding protein